MLELQSLEVPEFPIFFQLGQPMEKIPRSAEPEPKGISPLPPPKIFFVSYPKKTPFKSNLFLFPGPKSLHLEFPQQPGESRTHLHALIPRVFGISSGIGIYPGEQNGSWGPTTRRGRQREYFGFGSGKEAAAASSAYKKLLWGGWSLVDPVLNPAWS